MTPAAAPIPAPDAFDVRSPDGHVIHAYAWGTGNATVLIAHGFGDHGRAVPYRRLADALSAAGIRLVTYDHRGHGASRVLLPSTRWHHIVDDLRVMNDAVATRDHEPPTVVGLSMGGLAVLDGVLGSNLCRHTAVVVAAPIGPLGASRLAVALGKTLGRVWPTLPVKPGLDPAAIAADATLVGQYIRDPLFHMDMRAGLGAGLLNAAARVRGNAHMLKSPVLLLHGGADTMARWDTTFIDRAPAGLVRAQVFDHARHNLFLESVSDAVFAEIVSVARHRS